ncbi:MAG: lysophospholipid acyltransferase family protein [Thermoanaerobaculaceae bacterium]|nr:lysophospholipid acyltransferase family protein [Thermoanaerobaculaceae bacterium]
MTTSTSSAGQTKHPRPATRAAWAALNAVQLAFALLWSAACISAALVVFALTRRRAAPLAMARRLWAPGLLRGAGARVEVEGADELDAASAYLFAANHQSNIDVPALFVALPAPLRFVVKRELRAVPFLGWYIAAMGMVFVDRAGPRDAVKSMWRVPEILRAGQSVACFPEGTRSRDGAIRPFKSGSIAMAIEAGVPVVPVALIGTGGVLPPHGFRVRPGVLRVRVGRPIATAGLAVSQRGELARRVRDEVERLYAGR